MNNDSFIADSSTFINPENFVSDTYTSQSDKIKCVLSPSAKAPVYQTPGSAGADLCCYLEWCLYPHRATTIDTGVSLEIPEGYVGLVYIRSGFAKNGLVLANGVGVIDSDYRGNIQLCVTNTMDSVMIIPPYARLAQLVITPCLNRGFEVVAELPKTLRGSWGFGSTGVV